MKVNLEIEFGDATCAVEPGKLCQFVRVRDYGRIYECALFCDDNRDNQQLFDYPDEHPEGWLRRCPQCRKKWPGGRGEGVNDGDM